MIPKFRAWDTEHGQWSEEFFVYSKGGLYTPNYGFNRKHLKNRTDVYPIVKQERLILMQSTGLFDKNGKEIFEGDVVKCYIVTEKGEYEYVGVVCLKDFAFVIVDEKDTYDPLWNYKSGFVDEETEIEIIGNVYQNPGLVEGVGYGKIKKYV